MYRVELKVTFFTPRSSSTRQFLMYRVELKDNPSKTHPSEFLNVPNVPCGVESWHFPEEECPQPVFLMYRVELKVAV